MKSCRQPSIASPSCFAIVTILCLSILGLAGCGKGGGTTTVSGKISYNGKAVPGGLINFLAQGSRPLGGAINPDGTYSFELPPGDYQVRIDTPQPLPPGWKEGDPASKLPRPVPEKYASFTNSGLTAKVSAEESSQTIDFKLP